MKNKLLIIGSRGFIGGWLYNYLSMKLDSTKFEIYGTGSDHIDLSDFNVVDNLTELGYTHYINCVSAGSKDPKNSTQSDHDYNLKMINNFLDHRDRFQHYINIGSGAEIAYYKYNNPYFVEGDVWDDNNLNNPSPYAKSKLQIARKLWGENKFTTLRLFGCFGPGEKPTRLFRSYTDAVKARKKAFYLTVQRFSYFSIQDFCKVVGVVIENRVFGDFNCSYSQEDDVRSISQPTTKNYLDIFKYHNMRFLETPEIYYTAPPNLNKTIYTSGSRKLYDMLNCFEGSDLLGFEKSVKLYGI